MDEIGNTVTVNGEFFQKMLNESFQQIKFPSRFISHKGDIDSPLWSYDLLSSTSTN